MVYHDCHIHTNSTHDKKEDFIRRLDESGISKAGLLSYNPDSFGAIFGNGEPPANRLQMLMEWANAYPDRIIPFYWIDPLEDDALEQVDKAVSLGVKGFKVICNRHYPHDARPMRVWEHIAKANRPILFHSGILYARGATSQYNRPAFFEGLFDVPGLKFALAHVSWPWYDECIAVYGKWENEKRRGRTTSEMFIDTTPGSPEIYREDIFYKLYRIGYGIENNVFFGTDCSSDYDTGYLKEILEMDKRALDKVGITTAQREKYYAKNYERFLGL